MFTWGHRAALLDSTAGRVAERAAEREGTGAPAASDASPSEQKALVGEERKRQPAEAETPEAGPASSDGFDQGDGEAAVLIARDDSAIQAIVPGVRREAAAADVEKGHHAGSSQAGGEDAEGAGMAEGRQGSIEPKLYRLLSTVPQARAPFHSQQDPPSSVPVIATYPRILSLCDVKCSGSDAHQDAVMEG